MLKPNAFAAFMILDHTDLARAIFFIDEKGDVLREMHFTEFEAILDGFVPAPELANEYADAVLVEIDSEFHICTTVFFTVNFDSKGTIDADWNLPLDLLISQAGRGPDMGSGPIKLTCLSRCPIDYVKPNLWDPDLSMGRGTFEILHREVQKNTLGLEFRGAKRHKFELRDDIDDRFAAHLSREHEHIQDLRKNMAQLLRDQRLRNDTLQADRSQEIEQLRQDYNIQIHSYRDLLKEKDKSINELHVKNDNLKEIIEGQATKIEGLREYYEHKITQSGSDHSIDEQRQQKNYEVELGVKVEAATLELKELLQLREVELRYRAEQEKLLREDAERLREELQSVMCHTGDKLLEKMRTNGINLVTYQPGAGHITIPAAKLSRYLESPVVYAAEYCKVSEQQYLAWLAHYQTPVCQEQLDDSDCCHKDVPRVAVPAEFHMGDSDRCRQHKSQHLKPNLRLA